MESGTIRFTNLEKLRMSRKQPLTPTSPWSDRLARCRREMKDGKIAAYLISNRMDLFYLSGCTAEDSALLVTADQAHILSDGRFEESIDVETPWLRKHIRKKLLVDEIGKVCKRLKLVTLWVQPDDFTLSKQAALRKTCGATKIKSAPEIVNRLRRIKDEHEIAFMVRAIQIAEEAFQVTCRTLRPGVSERSLAARLEYEMRIRGADEAAFPSIVAEGANASRPHARAGDRICEEGSSILFDWGAQVGFYHSDLTRVVAIGRMPPRIRDLFSLVLEAQRKAIAAIRPGKRMCDIDRVARQSIKEAGYGKAFAHGLGHGLGLNVHESPSLSWRSKEPLEAGMVVTVEPGIYLPGVGGVRIEDDVLVTPEGSRVLSTLNKDLNQAVL